MIILLRQRLLISLLLLFCAVFFTGLITVCFVPRTYRAESVLIVSIPLNQVSLLRREFSALGMLAPYDGNLLTTSMGILKSYHVAEGIVNHFDLIHKWGAENMEEAVEMLHKVTEIAMTEDGLLRIRVELAGTPRVQQIADFFDAASALKRDLAVRQLVADIANQYVSSLQEYIRTTSLDQARTYRAFVERQFQQAKQELEDVQRRFTQFKQEKGEATLPEEVQPLLEVQTALVQEKMTAEANLRSLEAQLQETMRQIRQQIDQPEELPANSPVIQEWRQKLIHLQAQLTGERQKYGPEHPEVIRLQFEIAETERQIQAEVRRILQALQTKIAPEIAPLEARRIAVEAQIEALQQKLEEVKAQVKEVLPLETTLRYMELELRVREELYTTLATELKQAELTEAKESIQICVLDRAHPPMQKSSPSTKKNIMVAALLALMVEMGWLLASYRQQVLTGNQK